MKTQTSPNDSKSKTKKTKNQLINDILSHTKTNFKIKSEPASEDESVRKNRNHNKSVNDLDKASLISKLLTLESGDLTKRKRRKSQTVDTSSDVILSMKIKTENESEYNQDSHTIKERSSFSENIRNSLSPVRVLQEKSDSALINKERENLEKLFSKPGNLVINTPEPLHNGRLSVQKVSDSHTYKTKTSFSSNLQDKKSEKTKHKSFPLPKTIIKSEQLNIDQDQQGISHNSLKNKNQTDRKHFDMDNASDEEIPAPQHKMIKTEGYITKRSKEMHIPEPTPVKLENSYSSSDSSFENDNPTISVKGFNESKSLPMNDSTSSSDEEPSVPRPMIVKKEPLKRDKLKNRTVPVPLPIKSDMGDSDDSGSENGIVPSNKGLNVSKSRFKNDSSSDDETSVPRPILVKKEPLKRDKLNNRTVPVPLPIKSDVADSDSGSENGIDPINKGLNVSKSRFKNDSSSDDETSVPRPILVKKEPLKRDKLNNCTVPVPLPIKSDVADSDSGSENGIDPINKDTIMKHERNSSRDSSGEETTVPKPIKYKISENKRLSARHSVLSSTKEPKSRTISDFTPGAKKSPNLTAHKGSKKSKMLSTNESTSDDEASVPKPKLIKTETPKRAKSKKKSIPVPLPIKTDKNDFDPSLDDDDNEPSIEKKTSFGDRSGSSLNIIERKVFEPKSVSKDNNSSSSSSETSEEENNRGKKTSMRREQHRVPDSSSDEDENIPVPKPVKDKSPEKNKNLPMSSRMEQNKATSTSNSNHIVKWSIKAFAKENTSKAASSDDDSDSSNLPEVEAAVPNHQQGKRRTSKTNETNMPVPVPKPIKSDNISDDSNSSLENERTTSSTIAIGNLLSKYGTPKNKSSEKNKPIARSLQVNSNNTSSKKMQIKQQHSDDTYIKKPETSSSIQTEVNEASEEENESDTGIPQPKKIKLEELMTAPRRQIESEDERTISESMAMQQFNSMSWIEKLKFRFPTIEKQTVKTKLPENAKYSLLLLPKNINPHSLVNLKCHLNKDTRVSFNDNEYVLEPLPNKPDPVLVSLNGPKLVPLQSVISLQKYVPKLNLTDPKIPEREDIALPSAIKSRHPLFGANYKQKLSLGKQVKRKLQEAIEHKKKMEEKLAKRRRKRRKNSLKTEESVLNIFDSISSTPRGDDKFMDLLPVKLEESATSLDNAKSKKKKKRNSYNSEQYVTQTLNEAELLHKSKKRKREESLSLMDASEASHKKKKKKRDSKDFSEDNLDKPRKKRNHILEPE